MAKKSERKHTTITVSKSTVKRIKALLNYEDTIAGFVLRCVEKEEMRRGTWKTWRPEVPSTPEVQKKGEIVSGKGLTWEELNKYIEDHPDIKPEELFPSCRKRKSVKRAEKNSKT